MGLWRGKDHPPPLAIDFYINLFHSPSSATRYASSEIPQQTPAGSPMPGLARVDQLSKI